MVLCKGRGSMAGMTGCLTLCFCVGLASSQSQQYEAPESGGGNIFTGGLHQDNAIPRQAMSQAAQRTQSQASQHTQSQSSADNTCTFTFNVPSAQVQGMACAQQQQQQSLKQPDLNNMDKMHDDIIQVESRMIARDAYTRRELKRLQEQLHRERMLTKLGGRETGDMSKLPVDSEKLQVKLGSLDSEVTFLQTLTSELKRQVRYLEEQVRSADPSPHAEILTSIRAGNCPTNFERHNNSCYSYYREKRTWYKSRDFCQSLGGHLVSIETHDEQEFIKDFLKDKGVRRDTFWVYAGGNDLDNDGEWTWIGSNHIVRHPDFWYSDVTPPPDTGFVCMFLYLWDPDNFAKWTKDRCDFQMPSVCEISLVNEDS